MRVTFWKHRVGRFTFTVKEWSCCENLWQLLLSSKYPERNRWSPVCPTCGSIIRSY
jgi:hypothetical protein